MNWSAAQYSRFEDERNRPFADLLARLPAIEVRAAVDLGCGPGNSTGLLRARVPTAVVTGLDSSPDMIAAARTRLPNVDFAVADIATWDGRQQFGLVVANAALQWVPDHGTLLPRLLNGLPPGGVLAVQVPDNLDEPTHVSMRRVAEAGPWAGRMAGAWARWDERRPPEWYYGLLKRTAASVDLWRTTYFHPLPGGPAAIVEWFKGSALRPLLGRLAPNEQIGFLEAYERELAAAYPVDAEGNVLLPFPRLFWVATR